MQSNNDIQAVVDAVNSAAEHKPATDMRQLMVMLAYSELDNAIESAHAEYLVNRPEHEKRWDVIEKLAREIYTDRDEQSSILKSVAIEWNSPLAFEPQTPETARRICTRAQRLTHDILMGVRSSPHRVGLLNRLWHTLNEQLKHYGGNHFEVVEYADDWAELYKDADAINKRAVDEFPALKEDAALLCVKLGNHLVRPFHQTPAKARQILPGMVELAHSLVLIVAREPDDYAEDIIEDVTQLYCALEEVAERYGCASTPSGRHDGATTKGAPYITLPRLFIREQDRLRKDLLHYLSAYEELTQAHFSELKGDCAACGDHAASSYGLWHRRQRGGVTRHTEREDLVVIAHAMLHDYGKLPASDLDIAPMLVTLVRKILETIYRLSCVIVKPGDVFDKVREVLKENN